MLGVGRVWAGAGIALALASLLGVACSSSKHEFAAAGGAASSGGTATSSAGDSSAGRASLAGGSSGGSGEMSGGSGEMGGNAGATAHAGATGSAGTSSTEGGAPGSGDHMPGEACEADAACASGHCADGVCCNTACTDACHACNLDASPGQCVPVATGEPSPDGHPACSPQAASTCGRDGTCDGQGACRLYDNGTACADGSCDTASNSSVTGASCDGKGTCHPATPVSCAPFKCGGAACAQACNGDGDCVGKPCVNKSCGTVANGSVCQSDTQCTSGHCIDGLCCNSACNGSCQACDLAGKEGVCSTLPANAKPRGIRAACVTGSCSSRCDGQNTACAFTAGAACGTCHSCSAGGSCDAVAVNSTDAACPTNPTTCAAGGCGSNGACKPAASGTVCADYSCTQSTTGIGQYSIVDHHRKECNGALGASGCKATKNEGCDTFACDANAVDCKTSCSKDIDCVYGNYCKAGTCVAWIPTDSATACTADSQCVSRICSNGRCAECNDYLDCQAGADCNQSNFHCECYACSMTCTGNGLCHSARAPNCAANGACDCFGTPSCPAGTVCYRPNGTAKGQCLAPKTMPCHADADCAGGGTCNAGVCDSNSCAHTVQCAGQRCCGAYGASQTMCATTCP